uniref:Uncharacterized protein n=1 Tax=Cannabis sativa TaxID=3483 RepID=A0A803PF20_CANSA
MVVLLVMVPCTTNMEKPATVMLFRSRRRGEGKVFGASWSTAVEVRRWHRWASDNVSRFFLAGFCIFGPLPFLLKLGDELRGRGGRVLRSLRLRELVGGELSLPLPLVWVLWSCFYILMLFYFRSIFRSIALCLSFKFRLLV